MSSLIRTTRLGIRLIYVRGFVNGKRACENTRDVFNPFRINYRRKACTSDDEKFETGQIHSCFAKIVILSHIFSTFVTTNAVHQYSVTRFAQLPILCVCFMCAIQSSVIKPVHMFKNFKTDPVWSEPNKGGANARKREIKKAKRKVSAM